MFRVMKVRLYPRPAQEARLFDYLRAGRRVWNHFLEHRIKIYKRRGESTSLYQQYGMLTHWRSNDERMASIPVTVERDALRRLDRAFDAFFWRCKVGEKPGFPRFKAAQRWNSFEILGPAKYIRIGRVRVPKIGLIRCRNLREIDGKVKSLRVVLRAGKWFGQLMYADGLPVPEKKPVVSAVGLDLGLTSFVAGSDGFTIPAPKHFRRLEKKLARVQRRASRRKRGSRNRRKAVRVVQAVYARIADARIDFTHRLSKFIVGRHDLIAVEDLNVKGMAKGHFAKSILDAAWGQFTAQLAYKAERAGCTLVKVNPRGTSQECSGCAQTVPKTLKVRVHVCQCGLVLDRDVNAARVILNRGLDSLNIPPVGREFTPAEIPVAGSLKQEVFAETH